MTPLFSLDNVCFAYEGHIALRYITLDVARGETVVLQGSNGCGKSTLLKLLNGLVYAEEGTYKFDGDVIDEKSLKDNVFSKQFHQRVGFIFQNSDVRRGEAADGRRHRAARHRGPPGAGAVPPERW